MLGERERIPLAPPSLAVHGLLAWCMACRAHRLRVDRPLFPPNEKLSKGPICSPIPLANPDRPLGGFSVLFEK